MGKNTSRYARSEPTLEPLRVSRDWGCLLEIMATAAPGTTGPHATNLHALSPTGTGEVHLVAARIATLRLRRDAVPEWVRPVGVHPVTLTFQVAGGTGFMADCGDVGLSWAMAATAKIDSILVLPAAVDRV